MRRHLGSILPVLFLVAALAACNDDDSADVAQDPAPTGAASPTSSASSEPPTDPEGNGTAEVKVVDLVTMTAAGGTVDPQAVPMGDDAARQAFLGQFKDGGLANQVQEVVDRTDVPAGQQLYAAVVAVGCDAPTDVEVVYSKTSVSITAVKVPSPKPECLAAMTTVALVLVPTFAFG